MKIKRCTCRLCRYGLRTKYNSELVKHLKRSGRHKVKQLLKKGEFDNLPIYIAVPYTD